MPKLGAAIGSRSPHLRARFLSNTGKLQRALAALKTGRPARILSDRPLTVVSVETATPAVLDLLDPHGRARLLISGWRAAALSLSNRREAADPQEPVLIERADWLDAETARSLADPAQDGARGPLGPLKPVPLAQAAEAEAALKLARLAGLLPALWALSGQEDAVAVSIAEISIIILDRSLRRRVKARPFISFFSFG